MALIAIPGDFGQGGANISDGEPKLTTILQNHYDEITAAQSSAQAANFAAIGADEAAQGAIAASVKRYAAQAFDFEFSEMPDGVKSVELEFNGGTPLDSAARFLIAHLRQVTTFDNAGHTLISASVGTHADPEKYMTATAINNGANAGKTLTASGDGGLFLLAPVGGDAPILKITSPDDLNTIIAGTLGADLFYTTP